MPGARAYGDLEGFVSECQVHALDARINIRITNTNESRKNQESSISSLTKSGLNLTEPFFRFLADYENSGEDFSRYLPTILERLPQYGR